MRVDNSPGAVKRFRRSQWRFQRTFCTPLDNLEDFASAIISGLIPIKSGRVIIDAIVFEPKHLKAFLNQFSLSDDLGYDSSIASEDEQHIKALLRATLADWVDFLFVPAPKAFVAYADHDEYITFFAHTKSNLNRVVIPLKDKGFKQVQGYERQL